MTDRNLGQRLHPAAVAAVGASNRRGTIGATVMHSMVTAGPTADMAATAHSHKRLRWPWASVLLAALAWPAPGPAQPACTSSPISTGTPMDFAALAARVSPAVVKLTVAGGRGEVEPVPDGSDPFGQTSPDGGASARPAQWHSSYERSSASGFVIDPEGLIVTSAHAVAQAEVIWVDLPDERRLQGRVVGSDDVTDVALIKIPASMLSAVLPARDPPCPGEWVLAVGAPFGFDHSVTVGVVSANPRYLPTAGSIPLIQSDVALNPGSSGSPLFNARGEVVGMNAMVYSTNGGYAGVSFSLPIGLVLRMAQRIRLQGDLVRGHVGMTLQPVTPELASAFGLDGAFGALVIRVDPGGPAGRADVRGGDIVLTIDDAAPASYGDIQWRVSTALPDQVLTLGLWRRQSLQRVVLRAEAAAPTPAAAPAAPSAREQIRLGLSMMEVDPTGSRPPGAALYVIGVAGPARQAGLIAGDVVLRVNDAPVRSLDEFDRAMHEVAARPVVALLVLRRSVMNYIPVHLPGAQR